MLEEETRRIDGCDVEKLGTFHVARKLSLSLRDRWWPRTAKREGDKISRTFLRSVLKKRAPESWKYPY